MSFSLTDLTHFLDLGGIFILALLIINTINKKMDIMSDKLTKVLTLLVVVVKKTTNFNGVDQILQDEYDDISTTIKSTGHTV